MITFEKANGHSAHGSVEKGTLVSARAVKKINPNATILYYRNVIVHYGSYAADKALNDLPGAFLEDKGGNNKLVRKKVEPIKQVIEQPTPSASSPKEQPTSKIALVEQAQLNANPLPGSPQLNSGSSNVWTGTVSEAEDQFDTNLINGIDTVSDSKSKQPFSGKMQILNLNGNLIGEVNLLDGQLHGEEVFIDESGVITERNLWEKGVRIQ